VSYFCLEVMGVQGVDVEQLKAAKQDVLELMDRLKCGPILIRLAWHDSGTFDTVSHFACGALLPTRVPAAGTQSTGAVLRAVIWSRLTERKNAALGQHHAWAVTLCMCEH